MTANTVPPPVQPYTRTPAWKFINRLRLACIPFNERVKCMDEEQLFYFMYNDSKDELEEVLVNKFGYVYHVWCSLGLVFVVGYTIWKGLPEEAGRSILFVPNGMVKLPLLPVGLDWKE